MIKKGPKWRAHRILSSTECYHPAKADDATDGLVGSLLDPGFPEILINTEDLIVSGKEIPYLSIEKITYPFDKGEHWLIIETSNGERFDLQLSQWQVLLDFLRWVRMDASKDDPRVTVLRLEESGRPEDWDRQPAALRWEERVRQVQRREKTSSEKTDDVW